MDAVIRRASLPLTERDIADIAKLRESNSPWHQALREHARNENLNSEAAVLHAVFNVGLDRLRDEILATGYAALADSYRDADEAAYRNALRGRRRRHHVDREET